jgi:hypothetical protein
VVGVELLDEAVLVAAVVVIPAWSIGCCQLVSLMGAGRLLNTWLGATAVGWGLQICTHH